MVKWLKVFELQILSLKTYTMKIMLSTILKDYLSLPKRGQNLNIK